MKNLPLGALRLSSQQSSMLIANYHKLSKDKFMYKHWLQQF